MPSMDRPLPPHNSGLGTARCNLSSLVPAVQEAHVQQAQAPSHQLLHQQSEQQEQAATAGHAAPIASAAAPPSARPEPLSGPPAAISTTAHQTPAEPLQFEQHPHPHPQAQRRSLLVPVTPVSSASQGSSPTSSRQWSAVAGKEGAAASARQSGSRWVFRWPTWVGSMHFALQVYC